METENDVEDVQQTRLTKKHVRTLDTWKVHFEEWKGDQEVFRSDQCTVMMSKIRNMLNYTPGTYFKDRWLNDETIFAYASIFENDWCKTIGTTEYMSFERTGQLPKRWAAKCSNLAKASHILMPINCARTHWMMADIQPQSNEITIMDSYNHELMKGESKLDRKTYERYITYFMVCGFLKGKPTLHQHKLKHGQRLTNIEDCGVFCAIYARNVMTQENYEFNDTKNVIMDIRLLIAQSIYLFQDIRGKQEQLRFTIDAEDRLELKCKDCSKFFVSEEALKDHRDAVHPKDGKIRCIRCNKMTTKIKSHLEWCKEFVAGEQNGIPEVTFKDSGWKFKNMDRLNLNSPILKPPEIYDKIKLEKLIRLSINQRHHEIWSVKEAQVWDSERRMKENGCKVCTTSRHSRQDGDDEWITYSHKHYSTLHERIKWYESYEMGPLYSCKPCKKMHLVRDGERVALILTSNSIYKWWETEKRQDDMHIDYIQIPGATVKELLLALKTEYMHEKRPMDVLVIAGEVDTTWNSGESIYFTLESIKEWVLKKNLHNTCVFSTIPIIPNDVRGVTALTLLKIRTHDLNKRITRSNQIAGSTPPRFNSWGVKETGYEEGSKTKFKKGDWQEILLDENTRGCNSLCFKKQKQVAQGRACMTWFRIKYGLEAPVAKSVQIEKTVTEKRKLNNLNRNARRKRAEERRKEMNENGEDENEEDTKTDEPSTDQ